MLKETLKDAGEIIQHILHQPLQVPGLKKETSLLQAAADFDPTSPHTTPLHKIMLSFLQFPEPTEMMIKELELIQDDIESAF